jgi:hypothetical protein
MHARHTQDDHTRLPADRPGEAAEPVTGERSEATRAGVALAVEDPREQAGVAVAGRVPLASQPPPRAISGAEARSPGAPSALGRALANLDLLIIVPAALVALALGAPSFGVLVGTGGWLLQRAAAVADRRLIERAAEPGSRLGLNFVDAFARIWLLAGAIVVAGAVGTHEDGLAAALVIIAAYSIAFAVRIARGREGGPS